MSILNIDPNAPLVREELKEYAVIKVSLSGFFKKGEYISPQDCWCGIFADIDVRLAVGHVPADWTRDDMRTTIRGHWRREEKLYFQFTKNDPWTTIYVYVKNKESRVSQRTTVATIKFRQKFEWED